jgi:hypothetical protein
MHLMRTVLHKITARWEEWQYEAQRRATDAKLAELEALIADLKRSREAEREGSETRLFAILHLSCEVAGRTLMTSARPARPPL